MNDLEKAQQEIAQLKRENESLRNRLEGKSAGPNVAVAEKPSSNSQVADSSVSASDPGPADRCKSKGKSKFCSVVMKPLAGRLVPA